MTAAALLAEALQLARQLEFHIREDDLEGAGGGHCRYSGRKWLLLDVTQTTREQLNDALDALRSDPALRRCAMSPQLGELLAHAKRAA